MELRFLPTKPPPQPTSTLTGGSASASASGGGSSGGSSGGGTLNPMMTNGPNSYPTTNNNHHPHAPHQQHHQQHQPQQQQQLQNHQTVLNAVATGQEHLMLASMPHRRTLERSVRNLPHGGQHNGLVDQSQKMMLEGDCGVTTTVGAGVGIVLGTSRNNSSIRRGRRGSGSVPGSPRVGRGPSAELLQHNRSPMPIRAAASGVKRAARLGRAENMSSGSLNSIEV